MSETQSTHSGTGPGTSRLRQELTAAAIFLTRLPVRFDGDMPADLHGRALGWYPVIGALIGLCGAVVYARRDRRRVDVDAAALLTLGVQIALTGALHEDGLADVADGFGGGRDKMAKLAIMRDSRVGSYGVLALIFSVGLRWSALVALADPLAVTLALISAGALSRAVVPAVYGWLDPARTDGLAAGLGGPPGAAGRDGGGPGRLHRRAGSVRHGAAGDGGGDPGGAGGGRTCPAADRRPHRRRAGRLPAGRGNRGAADPGHAAMDAVTRWWLVRHAPAINPDGLIYGQAEIEVDCSNRAALETLAALLPPDPVRMVTPLARTRTTAEALWGRVDCVTEPALVEQSFGEWQGLSHNALAALGDERVSAFWQAPATAIPPAAKASPMSWRG